jgi:lysophospholipase L1-like esterase
MPRTRNSLLACLLGACLLLPGCGPQPVRRNAAPFPVLSYGSAEQKFATEIADMLARDSLQAPPVDGIALLGSSSFTRWDSMAVDLAPLPVYNRGFGGSGLRQAAYYAPQIVTPYRPRLVLVYCGENDICNDATPAQQALTDFQALVQVLRRAQPGLPVVFLSMKPSPKRWAYWPKFQEANGLIRRYTEEERGLGYFDVGGALLDSAGLPLRHIWRSDSLHLNAEGYAIWSGLLQPMLAQAYPAALPKRFGKN